MWFMYTFVPCKPRFCTSTGLVSKSLGCPSFWGTCANVCPCTDVLELVQPVLDQLARPAAAEPLSWGPSWKISAKPRTETVPELLEGKIGRNPLTLTQWNLRFPVWNSHMAAVPGFEAEATMTRWAQIFRKLTILGYFRWFWWIRNGFHGFALVQKAMFPYISIISGWWFQVFQSDWHFPSRYTRDLADASRSPDVSLMFCNPTWTDNNPNWLVYDGKTSLFYSQISAIYTNI